MLSSSIIGVLLLFAACDEPPGVSNQLETGPDIRSLNVSPSLIEFQESDGYVNDTTVFITIRSAIFNADENQSGYLISRNEDQALFYEGNLTLQNDNEGGTPIYEATVALRTSTTSFTKYSVEVFSYDETGKGSFAQTPLTITGFSNNPPVITETTSPDAIVRPEMGSTPATFTATVTDEDGNETISRVLLRIIDQVTGEVEGSPFDMADDGSSLGDQTADDQIYTWSLPVTETANRPDRDYDIEFFAIDAGGLSSDTVRTTFQIRGN